MRPRPLSLTNTQMDVIRQLAKTIPHDWRSRFLEGVADMLIASDIVTDDSVSRCAMQVAAAMMGDGGQCCE